MNLQDPIILVEKETIKEIKSHLIDINDVGAKTIGLCQIPSKWTLPFFVVSTNLFNECLNNTNSIDEIIQAYISNIKKSLILLGISGSIIIRSSAVNEGMQERGKFESIESTCENIEIDIKKLITNLLDIENDGMAFIIQQLSNSIITGHMSNERRFSKDSRDWKIELYYNNSDFDQDTIAIREWREKMDINSIVNFPLSANEKSMWQELRKVAYFWYYMSKNNNCRYHLEFVFDKKNIFIVQSDKDFINPNAINPKNLSVKVNSNNELLSLCVLKTYSSSDTLLKEYSKLNNVRTYNELNLPTVPLYYLNDETTIKALKSKKITKELKSDLECLLKIQSIIIRCDNKSTLQSERQLLPRSTELQNYEKVSEWLLDNCHLLTDDSILIIHNYIPSVASAFAYATPNNRIVRIQSLWGLPEGLYYNSHDTIIVDLSNKPLNSISESDVNVIIRNKFKDKFVFPMPDGSWKVETIAIPYDWKCSIDNKSSIFEIARASQMIADYTNTKVSVMWFVEIDQNYYNAKNLPWYHEHVDLTSYTPDDYKRKYFTEEEIIITDIESLENLLKCEKTKTIRCIRIKPTNEKDLRDKNFIKKVGELAKEKDIPILLEGTQLTHSYYQLKETGANVVCSERKELMYTDTLEFNKLVRDRIPEKIIANGENVKCGIVKDVLYYSLLFEKLLEETLEVYDSQNISELISELADVQEICDTILNCNSIKQVCGFDISSHIKKSFTNTSTPLFTIKIEAEETQKVFPIQDSFLQLKINRNKTYYKFEVNLTNYKPSRTVDKVKQIKPFSEICNQKNKLVKKASQLLNRKTNKEIIQCVTDITNIILEICELLNFPYEDIKEKQDNKRQKNGGFEKGYVLLQTTLKDSVIDAEQDFAPENCHIITNVEKRISKYSDYLNDKQENKERFLMRFNVPVTINEWKTDLENSAIKRFISDCDKLSFNITKKASGNLFVTVEKDQNMIFEQLSLF